jgi:hypothetical protein
LKVLIPRLIRRRVLKGEQRHHLSPTPAAVVSLIPQSDGDADPIDLVALLEG